MYNSLEANLIKNNNNQNNNIKMIKILSQNNF